MRCVDCGTHISRYATRCRSCSAKRTDTISLARAVYIEIYGMVLLDAASLRRRMSEWGMDVRQTEREAGVPRMTVTIALRRGSISLRNLNRLTMLFGCEPSELQGSEPCPECGKPATPGYICCDECRARLREMIA